MRTAWHLSAALLEPLKGKPTSGLHHDPGVLRCRAAAPAAADRLRTTPLLATR
jgi:hypothetical protein